MTDVERARAVVSEVLARVERRWWPRERVREAFCRRDAREVLVEGAIHFGTPCCDLSSAAGLALREAGFLPVPVLCRIHRWFQPVKFQCGLELTLDGAPFHLGFSVTTNRLAPGRFVPVRSRTDVLRADPRAAAPGAPHLRFFGVERIEDLDRAIRGHRLPKHLASYDATASARAFAAARAKAVEKAAAGGIGLLGAGAWADA
jgi:hypothetical protein